MAPSHSTPQQVERTLNNIIVLIDSIDNKVLQAYHDYIAAKIREPGYDYSLNNIYATMHHIYALKIVLQTERRQRAIATNLQDQYTRKRTSSDTQ